MDLTGLYQPCSKLDVAEMSLITFFVAFAFELYVVCATLKLIKNAFIFKIPNKKQGNLKQARTEMTDKHLIIALDIYIVFWYLK